MSKAKEPDPRVLGELLRRHVLNATMTGRVTVDRVEI
jgi:hypothetical protein